jgi:hypothetical protein
MDNFREIPGLDIFPARVRKGVKVITPSDDTRGKFSPATGEVTIPVGDSAYERTVRLHESLHAIHSAPCGTGELYEQAFEDMRLHMRHAPTEGGVRRDEIATALIDLRSMAQIERDIKGYENAEKSYQSADRYKRDKDKLRYQGAAIMARSMAILTKTDKRYDKAVYDAERLIGLPVVERLTEVVEAIKLGDDQGAKDELERLFNGLAPASKDPDPDPPKVTKTSKIKDLLRSLKRERNSKKPGHGSVEEDQDYVPPMPSGLDKGLDKEIRKAIAQNDRTGHGKMRIRRLEMSEPKEGYGPTERMQIAGMRIRAKKLASVAASPSPGRVFIRKIHKQGGVCLIDASGSMDMSNAQLRRIADQVPAGMVAYYSGESLSGDLVIFAEKGKQYNRKKQDLPYRHGGNQIDMAALLWLLNQPGPRYFVTDGGFCGEHASEAAKKLLENSVKTKKLTWVRSVNDLARVLNIKKKAPQDRCMYCGGTSLKPYPLYEDSYVQCKDCTQGTPLGSLRRWDEVNG